MSEDIELFADGWVFLIEGSNSVGDYYLKNKKVSALTLQQWGSLLSSRATVCSDKGIRYLHIAAPEKLAIYADKSKYEVLIDNSPAVQVQSALDEEVRSSNWLNPADYLRSQKEHYKVYSKTDSHWNFYGAFSVYQMVQAKLNLPINPNILDGPKVESWTVMDLGGKYDPPLPEKVFFYTASDNVERVYANEIVQYKEKKSRTNDAGLHTGSYVVFENRKALVDSTLMVFGDSFSEYRLHLLTGMFAETYRKVHFIWSSNVDWDLVDEHKPDYLVTELAERFMAKVVPSDKFSVAEYSSNLIEKFVA